MPILNSTERVLRTFQGKPLDRLPIFDIIHNVEFIEEVTEEKVTSSNAEDVVCEAVRKTLDLVRHFCIPEDLGVHEVTDEDGFTNLQEFLNGTNPRDPLSNPDTIEGVAAGMPPLPPRFLDEAADRREED